MAEQELTYQEVMALLPGYAAGLLNNERQAAVDQHLQRQIALFQHLDELERAAGVAPPAPNDRAADGAPSAVNDRAQPRHGTSYAQVMEGERPSHELSNNPFMMRNAPQSYTDRRTGQRFVVPKRGTLHEERAPRNFPAPPVPLPTRLRRWAWNLLALAAVVAVLLIGAYQVQLQRQLALTQEQLTVIKGATRVLLLQGDSTTGAMRGTLFLGEQRALFSAGALANLPATQRYQLWYTTATGDMYTGGIITVGADQSAQQLIPLAVPATTIVGAGLSVEPVGGSVAPTLPMVLEASWVGGQ
ncbi:MAG: anti-sigma factor [Caldilineaceae bacterium]|nr:anti-sigma factor [Caldilineaceae bacterium]